MSHIGETSVAPGAKRLKRLIDKPTLADWGDDEPLSLAEAFELDVTRGALSPKGLRTAVRKGEVASSEVAGKIWITKHAVRVAFAPKPAKCLEVREPLVELEKTSPKEKGPAVSLAMAKIAAERNAGRRRLTGLS
jgi:hypothetical protein